MFYIDLLLLVGREPVITGIAILVVSFAACIFVLGYLVAQEKFYQ